NMENLPDEILLQIFSKLSFIDLLSGVRCTCWRWYHLSSDSTLWSNIDLSLIKCFRSTDSIQSGIKVMLREVHSCLEHLTFSNIPVNGGIYELFGSCWKRKNKVKFEKLKSIDYSYSDVSSRNLRVALTNHPDIEELILVHTKITLAQVLDEAIHLPNLKCLVYHDSKSRDINSDRLINKLIVMKVPRHCQHLEAVELHTLVADLDCDVLSQFFKYCTKLRKLSLTWSTNMTADSFTSSNLCGQYITHLGLHDRQQTGPYLDFVLPHFPNLLHLTVGGKNIHLDDTIAISEFSPKLKELELEISCEDVLEYNLTNFFNSLCGLQLQIIAEKCTLLTKLHVPCSNIDDDSVIFLAKHCLFLEDLNFSQCHRLTKNSLFALSKHCLRLKKVSLQDTLIDHRYMIGLVTKCSNLDEVILDHKSPEISLATSAMSTSVSTEIENNHVDLCPREEDIPFIDMTLSAEELEMQHVLFNNLSSPESSSLSSSCDACFMYPEAVTCTPVKISHCHLKKLSLKYSLAKEKYLQEIIRECPDLTYVSLDGSKHLTDNLIITLAKCCPNLRHLGISSTPSQSTEGETTFGDAALLALVQCSHNLEGLQCLYNCNITSIGVTALFQSLSTTLRSLTSFSLCVGLGYSCNIATVVLHGFKYLTERSKQQLKDASATARGISFIVLHLDLFKKR
ncbi:FBXL2_20, partial [Biomphalaria pfeifferi]